MKMRGAISAVLVTVVLVTLSYQRPVIFGISPVVAQGLEGFGAKGLSQGRSWRWTSARSQMRFPLAGQVLPAGGRLGIDLGLPPRAAGDPRTVTLALDGQFLGSIDVGAGFNRHEFAIPGEKRSAGDWVLTLETQGVGLDSHDPRGVALVRAELLQPWSPSIPALRTLLLAVLGALALGAFLEPRLAPRSSVLAVLVAAGTVSLGLAFARPQAVSVLPWLSGALALLGAPDAIRRGLSTSAAAHVVGFAPFIALVALVAGATGLAPVAALVVALGAIALTGIRAVAVGRTRHGEVRREWGLVLALLAFALAFRVYRLEEIPFAIFRDEARHGLLALRLLDDPSYHPLFVGPPINQPLPYFLAVAGALKTLGTNLFALRIVSALAGALAVPLLYGLVREIFGARVGVVAALLLAVSSWHVSISRFAVNYVEPSLFSLPAYWLLWRALPRARVPSLCLAAFLVGLGQYSAHTAKALFIVTAGLVTEELVLRVLSRDFAGLRKLACGLSLAAAVGLVTLSPLFVFVRENPDDYLARAQQVSVWSHAAATGNSGASLLAQNLRSYALAFHWSGDRNGRHHLPGAPLLDPVAGLGLLAGLFLALARPTSRRHRFLLLWLVAGLLPGLLTVDAPSGLRTIEAAPAVYSAAALGLLALWEGRQSPATPGWRAVPVVVLAGAIAWNAWVYFVRMYHSPAVWLSSAAIGTQVGKRLGELRDRGLLPEQIFLALPRRFWEDSDNPYVLRFFLPRKVKIGTYDGPVPLQRRADAILLPNEADLWRLATAEDPTKAPRFARALADQARWRGTLDSALNGSPIQGPSFPGTDRPAFWLYLPTGER